MSAIGRVATPESIAALATAGGNAGNQARVERLGNQIFGAEFEFFGTIGAGHDIVGFGQRQIGDGVHAGELHFFVDGGGAHIQRAAEDKGGSTGRY